MFIYAQIPYLCMLTYAYVNQCLLHGMCVVLNELKLEVVTAAQSEG
jgi:hypothetical protein